MRTIPMLGAVAAALAFAPAAHAAQPFTSVFQDAPSPLTCTVQTGARAGQRWCGSVNSASSATPTAAPTVVPSFDGTPIDATVALPPAPASGPDGGFPVVGIYHGYGGFKASLDGAAAQRWLAQGYAVFSITDRGFWGSCGLLISPKPPSCAKGYIHLMSNAYEVHDAQQLLGMLADDGAIDPQRIGATGGSYGGGMSAQLGALKDRVLQTDGTVVPWTSPRRHLPMQIAATAPEYGWSDLTQALMPNGSGLDYAAENPYTGPAGDRRFGIQKNIWNLQLYGGGLQAGYYAAPNADPVANISIWLNTNLSGGPYDGEPFVDQQLEQFPSHGSYGVDDGVAPAPALLSNGWNDDLFPVDEALRYYNKIRADHPDTPISMMHLDFGHGNRAATPSADGAARLATAENAWFAHYVRGDGPTPDDAVGGVTAVTSVCPVGTDGTAYRAKNWASLAPGEIRVQDAAAQTIAPDTAPATIFSPPLPTSPSSANPTVCTSGPNTPTVGAARYETAPAPDGGFTIAGAPTIVADLTVPYVNDAVIGRLYDVDVSGGTQRLIARGTYRPTGVSGTTRQVFQLHPQAWHVDAGHVVRLELLGRDAPYALAASGQTAVGVANLELRLPTIDAPGAAGGLVTAPAAKVLPKGYELAADLRPAVTEPPAPPAAPAPVAPAPDVPAAPKPAAPKDALTADVALAVLRRPTTRATVSASRRTVRFSDRLPEAGRASYRLTLRVKGKDRTVGTGERRVTKLGTIVVTIKPTTAGRALLKAHPRTSLRLRTSFVTAIERRTLVSVRTVGRK
ncbi:CocE/NonD family hydrolase [Patulibacter sp. NPDC049589]|uniref:CocE/NonD family hydrolase n=1 Tax=Patulibacter sp. NPDC049589 TaxID=3154731 RepID=UPI00342CDB2D